VANGIANDKSLATMITELKQEFKDFVQTRYEMFNSEMQAKLDMVKMAAPMFAIAAVMAVVAFLCLTAALIAAIAMAFNGTVGGWALSAAIVGVAYLALGGLAAMFAYREISTKGLAPKRTLKVLKQDQIWLSNEARSQL